MSSEQKAGEPRGFTITDRRSVTDTDPPAPPPEVKPSAAVDPPAAEPAKPGKPGAALPPVEFATFVLSLGSSALMHLGEVERPGTGATEKNLPMAKHSIDILSMLEQKTKGNLSAPEAQLLENLLFDLRLRYVEATRK